MSVSLEKQIALNDEAINKIDEQIGSSGLSDERAAYLREYRKTLVEQNSIFIELRNDYREMGIRNELERVAREATHMEMVRERWANPKSGMN